MHARTLQGAELAAGDSICARLSGENAKRARDGAALTVNAVLLGAAARDSCASERAESQVPVVWSAHAALVARARTAEFVGLPRAFEGGHAPRAF